MTKELVYENVIEELLATIPELKPLYEEDADMWLNDYIPYVVFGFVVVPTLTDLLLNDSESPVLKRIFDFIELMITSEHEYVHTLAAVEISEWIAFDSNDVIRTNAMKLMGPWSLEQVNKMVDWRPESS